MADIQSNIQVNIDTSSALASIKALQGQISAFQKEMASSSASNALVAKNLQKALIDDVNATGKFSASIKTVSSTTDYFTRALEKNKLSLGEYYRYGMASSKSFSRMFQNEFDTINKVARERVKDLQTQYISLGKDAAGATKAIAIRPLALDLESVSTKAQIAAQRTQIFNQILKQGSTNLLNFGKNTQWAGRQLMVGFTIPLSIFGAKAAQEFKNLEEQAIRFKRVYGDAMTPPEEVDKMIGQLQELGLEFTKYGVALKDTMQLAADAAAMGKTGSDLLAQVSQANILGVLGGVDQAQALETTISLTNAFGYSAEQLTNKVNFLNAVENQTVLSIEDLTTAIPKAGPVVQQLGGNVEDLAFFMTAMKEGGINASEGANALKSGLASLINPTSKASNMLLGMGINLKEIVSQNEGNVAGVVVNFAKALDTLDPTTRAQAIEQLFGKFQFSRLSTLFQNVIDEGTQASRVLEITNMTTAQLAAMSRKELGQVEESSLYKFQAAIERFNAALAPVGEQFMKMVTPLIDFGTKMLDMFNNMSDGAKTFVTAIIGIVGGIAPVFIMTFGLIANAIANGMKGFLFVKNAIQGTKQETTDLGLQTQYMSTEQLEAATVAASLDQVHSKLVQTFTSEASAINQLRIATERAVASQARFGGGAPSVGKRKGFANGGIVVAGPGGPKGDKIPANLSDGEVVLTAETVKENPGVVNALLAGGKVKIPGFAGGTKSSGPSEFAHITDMYEISVADFVKRVEESGKTLSKGVQNWITDVQKVNPNTKLRVGSGFGFAQAPALNLRMREGGSVPTEDFLKDFTDRGADKWRKSISLAGEKFSALLPEIETYDKALSDAIVAWKDMTGKTQITSQEFAQIEKAVRDNVLAPTSKLKTAIEKVESGIHDVRANISENFAQSSGATVETVERPSRSRPGQTTTFKRIKDTMLRIGGNRKFGKGVFGGVSNQDLGITPNPVASHDAGVQDAVAYQEGKDSVKKEDIYPESRKRNSPHPLAPKDGTDDAKAYDDARVAQLTADQAKVARAAAGQAATYGGATPTPALKAARRKFGSVENIPPAVMSKITSGMTEAGDASAKAATSINTVANRAMAASGALSSAVFMLQGFGVDLGGFGAVVTTVSNAMFTLAASTTLLSRSQNIQNALNLAGLGSMKNFTSLFKGGFFSGIKNLFGSLRTFGGALTGLTGIVARLIPWVGGAIIAFEVLKFFSKEITTANQKITGLGDVAKLTADKLNKIGSAFGFDPAKSTDFGARVGTNDASAGTQKAQTGREKLLSQYEGEDVATQFDNFKKDFAAEINGLSEATKEQATRALESTARQLYGSGATQEAVSATIQTLISAVEDNPALQKVNTSKIIRTVFDPKDPKSLDAITKAAQTSAQQFTKSYEAYKKANPASQETSMFGPNVGYTPGLGAGVVNDAQPSKFDAASMREMSLWAAETATSADALYQAFDLGSIGADKLMESVNGLMAPIESLSADVQEKLVPLLVDELGPSFKEQTKDIKDYKDVLYMAKYVMAGGVITKGQINTIKSGTSAITVLGGTYGELAKETDKARTAEEKRQATVDNTAYVKGQIEGLSDQIKSYNILRDAGYDAATALALTNDETIRSQVVSAGAADKLGEFGAKLKEMAVLMGTWKKISNTGGGSQKNPFKDAVDSLKEQRKEISNSISAFSKLKKAGVNAVVAWKYAQDPTVAAGLAAAKTAKQVRQIVAAVKELEKAAAKVAWGNWTRDIAAAKSALDNQLKMAKVLGNIGATAEEVDQLLSDENLAAGFKAGTINAVKLEAALKKIRENKEIEIKIKMQTPEGMQEIFDEAYSKVQDAFSAKETQITIDFKLGTNVSGENKDLINTDKIDKTIAGAEDDIAKLNYQIDDYEAGIQQIQWQEDAINKKYEDRGKALDKIQKINDNISRQQKAQLTIADALSQGDIAAAAKAIEDARAQDASAAIDQQKTALDNAQQAELAALTDAQGRNRASLEASILDLKKQIFTIEETTLEPATEARRQADLKLKAAIDSITVLGKNKTEWEGIKNQADMARVNSDKYKTAIQGALDIVTELVKKWGGLDGKVITTTHKIITENVTSGGSTGGKTGNNNSSSSNTGVVKQSDVDKSAADYAASGLSVSGYIKKVDSTQTKPFVPNANLSIDTRKALKASGGRISMMSGMGSDTVPAMLTPGEFVMRRSAVSKYGLGTMRAMNSGNLVPNMSAPSVSAPVGSSSAPSVIGGSNSATNNNSSVYNYSLSVNVGSSNAGAQEIANAVMGKIKSVDSQRVRGVRL